MALEMFADEALLTSEAGREKPQCQDFVSASTAYISGREAPVNRGWTQSQINALTPDPVIPPDKSNHLAVPVPRDFGSGKESCSLNNNRSGKNAPGANGRDRLGGV